MLRHKLFHADDGSLIRGTEIFRVEALSDAVFAFSVSLLIMSLEVPNTYEELQYTISHFLPFLATVSLVFFFWYLQNQYFRAYGLNTSRVIVLNLALLILILFYAFPLKFLFSLLLSWITGINYFEEAVNQGKTVLLEDDFPKLILFFSIGYALIWFIFHQLYSYAWKHRNKLQLSPAESVVLRFQKQDALVEILIGGVAAFCAMMKWPTVSGFVFLLIPVWLVLQQLIIKRRLKKLPHRK